VTATGTDRLDGLVRLDADAHRDLILRWIAFRRANGEIVREFATDDPLDDETALALYRVGQYWFRPRDDGEIELAVGYEVYPQVPTACLFHFWIHPKHRRSRRTWHAVYNVLDEALQTYDTAAVLLVDSPFPRVRAVRRAGFEYLGGAVTEYGKRVDILAMDRERLWKVRRARFARV
jgi:hypothetical protein